MAPKGKQVHPPVDNKQEFHTQLDEVEWALRFPMPLFLV